MPVYYIFHRSGCLHAAENLSGRRGLFEEGEIPVTTTAIRLDQITRDFGSVRALDHLSLQVPAGVICGFLGPNGAGKATTR